VLLRGGPIDALLTELGASDAAKDIAAGAAPVPLQGDKPIANYLHALETDKARALVVDGPGDPPLTHALLPPPPDGAYLEDAWREDAWSLLLRGLRWAAHRDPEVAITGMSDTSPKGPNEEEIQIWNAFLAKRGWRDAGSAGLEAAKKRYGWADRDDIQTWIDLHDVDEGRTPGWHPAS